MYEGFVNVCVSVCVRVNCECVRVSKCVCVFSRMLRRRILMMSFCVKWVCVRDDKIVLR